RHREGGDQPGDNDPEGEGEPDRLGAELSSDGGLAGATGTCDLRGRPVLQEVEDREDTAEDRRRDAEGRELRAPEVSDDRGVDEEVERLGGKRTQRGEREPQNLAVVPRAQGHAGAATASIVAS